MSSGPSRPTLQSVSIVDHHLIGYVDFIPGGGGKLEHALSALEAKHVLLPFLRPLLSTSAVRAFIYLPSRFICRAQTSTDDPLSCLQHPCCPPSLAHHLSYAFEHLSWDWHRAWIGLSDDVTTATATATATATSTSSLNGASLCGVPGCTRHPTHPDVDEFDLGRLLETLAPPRPTDLVGRTGGLNHPLLRLSEEVTHRILSFLDVQSVRRMDVTCCTYYFLNYCPGLRTINLLPHQRAALSWMLRREGRGPEGSKIFFQETEEERKSHFHPCRQSFQCYEGPSLVFDSLEHCVLPEGSHNYVLPVRGGLFCDDPGLGKTITMISLSLRTFRSLPPAPDEFPVRRIAAAVEPTNAMLGRKYLYCYEVDLLDEETSGYSARTSMGWYRRSKMSRTTIKTSRTSPRLQRRLSGGSGGSSGSSGSSGGGC